MNFIADLLIHAFVSRVACTLLTSHFIKWKICRKIVLAVCMCFVV